MACNFLPIDAHASVLKELSVFGGVLLSSCLIAVTPTPKVPGPIIVEKRFFANMYISLVSAVFSDALWVWLTVGVYLCPKIQPLSLRWEMLYNLKKTM